MKILKHIESTIVLFLILASQANAGGVIGATEPTQILNNTQLVQSYVEQVQQTITQIKQYEAMLKNLMSMTPSALLGNAAEVL